MCVHVHVQIYTHLFACVWVGGGEGREKGRLGVEVYSLERGTCFALPPSVEPGGVSDMRLGRSQLLSAQCSSLSQSDQSDSSLTAAPAQYDVMANGL